MSPENCGCHWERHDEGLRVGAYIVRGDVRVECPTHAAQTRATVSRLDQAERDAELRDLAHVGISLERHR